jgi:hypothetical protein
MATMDVDALKRICGNSFPGNAGGCFLRRAIARYMFPQREEKKRDSNRAPAGDHGWTGLVANPFSDLDKAAEAPSPYAESRS